MSEDKINNGGAAFPSQPILHFPSGDVAVTEQGGMTLRDYIAIAAMQGDWASQNSNYVIPNDISMKFLELRTELYYKQADAMLKARGS